MSFKITLQKVKWHVNGPGRPATHMVKISDGTNDVMVKVGGQFQAATLVTALAQTLLADSDSQVGFGDDLDDSEAALEALGQQAKEV
jgi:hypothetical protein